MEVLHVIGYGTLRHALRSNAALAWRVLLWESGDQSTRFLWTRVRIPVDGSLVEGCGVPRQSIHLNRNSRLAGGATSRGSGPQLLPRSALRRLPVAETAKRRREDATEAGPEAVAEDVVDERVDAAVGEAG